MVAFHGIEEPILDWAIQFGVLRSTTAPYLVVFAVCSASIGGGDCFPVDVKSDPVCLGHEMPKNY